MNRKMFLLKIIKDGLSSFSYVSYLIETEFSVFKKIVILLHYIRINLKFIFIDKIFSSLRKEKFLGYSFYAFRYLDIRFLFEEIFYKNEYFFKSNNQIPVIFDCGANVGFATIYFKHLYPNSIIYAFEPDPQTFEILKKNIKENKLKDVHLFNVALSEKNRKIKFFNDPQNPGSLLMSTKKERMFKKEIVIDSICLSSFIKKHRISKIDFLKIDVEGSEMEIITDLDKKKLLKCINRSIIEYHHNFNIKNKPSLGEFLKIFEKNNFQYQVDTRCIPIHAQNKFQDITISIY